MAQDIYPTFPAEFRGGYERIPPSMLEYQEDEAYPRLLDTQGNAIARIVPIRREQLKGEALQKIATEEREHLLGLLHTRETGGTLKLPERGYV